MMSLRKIAAKFLSIILIIFYTEVSYAADCNSTTNEAPRVLFFVNDRAATEDQLKLIRALYKRAPNIKIRDILAEQMLYQMVAEKASVLQGSEKEKAVTEATAFITEALGPQVSDFHCSTIQEGAIRQAMETAYVSVHIAPKLKPTDEDVSSFIKSYRSQFAGQSINEARTRVFKYLWEQAVGKEMEDQTAAMFAAARFRYP